jgi:uncharacterized protein (DUF433 family)
MAKAEPFSVRLTVSTDKAVEAEARRVKRSKSQIVESLTEEAMRTRRFPGIAFRGEDAGRRPWLIGTGLDIWEACQMLDEYGSPEELVKHTQLTERHLMLATAYAAEYPDEIAEAIAENTRPVEEWQQLYPFVLLHQAAG